MSHGTRVSVFSQSLSLGPLLLIILIPLKFLKHLSFLFFFFFDKYLSFFFLGNCIFRMFLQLFAFLFFLCFTENINSDEHVLILSNIFKLIWGYYLFPRACISSLLILPYFLPQFFDSLNAVSLLRQWKVSGSQLSGLSSCISSQI